MKTLTRGWPTVLAGVALAACSEGTGPELVTEAALDADVAMVAAQATIDDVAEMWLTQDMLGPLGAQATDGMPGHGNPNRRPDLSRSRTVTFYDAQGHEMDGYDPLLTASIGIVLDATASRQGELWEGLMERHREMTLSNLLGEETERVWNGTGTDEVTRTRFDDETGDRSYTMEGSVDISGLTVGVPRIENPWPLSGTITRHIEVTIVNGPNGDQTFERNVTITFDGTQYATLVVNGETFEIDLADREGHRPRRRRGG